MANRYWVGGTGTWNTSSTTNWSATSGGASGESVPTAADSVFFDQATTYTVTMTGALLCLDFTVSAGTVTFATGTTPTLAISGSWSIVAATVWSSTGTITFNSTTTGNTITTNAVTINAPVTFNGVGGAWSLGSALTTGVTLTTTLTNGSLILNGFNLITGIFDSNVTTTRAIAFGANNINLVHTTAGTTVLNMPDTGGFTFTGTGGFTSGMSATRTFNVGPMNSLSGSLFFNNSTSRLTYTTTTPLIIGTNDFTVEAWINLSKTSGNQTIWSTNDGAGSVQMAWRTTGTELQIQYFSSGTLYLVTTTSANLTIGVWTHIAFVRISGVVNIYVNGISKVSQSYGYSFSGNGTSAIGTLYGGTSEPFFGYISNFRLVNGLGVYTGNFTPSTSPLTATQPAGTNISAISGTQTSLLLNTPNNVLFITDSSSYNFIATNTDVVAYASTPITTFPAGGTPPNLAINSGASIPTIVGGSTFNILDFTGSSTTPATTSLSIASGLTLSSGGTYTGLTVSATGVTNISGINKTIAALSLNNGTSTTTVDTTGLSITGQVTMLQGSLALNGNLSSSSFESAGTSRTMTGTNTTYTITGSGTSAWNYSPTGSASFNGTNQYLSVANNAALQFSGDFTVEMWIYPTAFSGFKGLFGQRSSEANYSPIIIELSAATLTFFVSTSGSAWAVSLTSPSITANTWTHIALVRSGTTVSYYINGVAGGTTGTATGALMTPVAPTYIGIDSGTPSGAGYFSGYISNLRIVKGVAVYTGNFTVPTGPLTATQTANPYGGSNTSAITGTQTSLLLNTQYYNNFIADSSTNNFTLTNNGGVTYSTIAPAFTVVTPGFTGTGFIINMTSAAAKTFSGNGGTYPVLNQGGSGPLTIVGTTTFNNITNTFSGLTVTFPSSTTTTFSNFSLAGSSTGGGAATGYPLGSVSFNGTSQYLSVANNTALNLNATFTVEGWFYFTALSVSADNVFYNKLIVTPSLTGVELGVKASGAKLYAWLNGADRITGNTTIVANTWYHFAITRDSSNNLGLFVNGVSDATAVTYAGDTTTTASAYIAAQYNASSRVTGSISNFRIVKGVAVYTGNFTVPTDPLSATQSASTNIAAITGTQTSLLLNTPNSASFITDSSVNNFTVTNTGTATANSLSPFLCYITSSTSGTSATISKSSGVVYGSGLSIKDSNATGGATWYAGPTSVNVSNNTGWVFTRLPIITMGNVSINGGITFS